MGDTMGSSCSSAGPSAPPAPKVCILGSRPAKRSPKTPRQRWRSVLTVVRAFQEKLPNPMDHALDVIDSDSCSDCESSESLEQYLLLVKKGKSGGPGHPLTRFKSK